ncbi:GGDEF domain-containing protein [Massilia sp. BJB1822]|uniref:GGDEF domain-containing protein n=1 Tax=Massilia sp. BJB1822 TaxID=2744470 RepID=UPI001593EC6B|nr:GGDEF domain-containing protein [Massilia sp. BJB1822]NVD98699.1 diguanylate cyclase [Massilia sp. BJB1822]
MSVSFPRFALTKLVCLLALCGLVRAEPDANQRQILVLYSMGADSASLWQRQVHKGLYDELGSQQRGSTPAIFEERFDALRVGESASRESMAPYLRTKYANIKFDAIVTENYVAADFLDAHPGLFAGVPRYYVNHGKHDWTPVNATGLEVKSDFARSIGVIPQTAPQVKRIVVVGDGSARVQGWIRNVRALEPQYAGRIAFEYWDDYLFEDLPQRAAGLDGSSALFIMGATRDRAGKLMPPPELARRLTQVSQAPIFTHIGSVVQPGVIGGYVVSGEHIGRAIARILLGQPGKSFDVQTYMFDYPTAQRFHIRNAPEGSVWLNRPHNVWDLYRWQIIAGLSLIGLEGVLITALVLALRDRRRTLATLNEERNSLEDRVLQRTLELLMANKKLEQLATTDPLTGIANRRKMTEQIAREIERARRFNHPLSLLMIDIDHFKRINDTYGHDAGDKAIVAVSKLLTESMRGIDMAARFGGEEFVLLMPETEAGVAVHVAERLREAVAGVRVGAEDGAAVALTVSIGVAALNLHEAADTSSTMLIRADKALYRAKKEGRNRVVRF